MDREVLRAIGFIVLGSAGLVWAGIATWYYFLAKRRETRGIHLLLRLRSDHLRTRARQGEHRLVGRYFPRARDIIWLDFDPQAGREQAKRRPALVITDEAYNPVSGRAVVCPLTRTRKPYPFSLPTVIGRMKDLFLFPI